MRPRAAAKARLLPVLLSITKPSPLRVEAMAKAR